VSFTFHYNKLGFTEDDFFQITPYLDGFTSSTIKTLVGYFVDPIQGRPIGYSVPLIMSALSASLGGKLFLSIASSTIFVLLFIVSYKIFFYLFNNKFSATTGALFLVFFPADTTHTFWVHAFQLHTSLLIILAGIWYLISRKKIVPYILLGFSLLTYESTVSIFLIFPILLQFSKKNWIVHIAKSMIIIITILLSRVLIMSDSSRIEFIAQDLIRAAKHIRYSLVIGTYTSISSSVESFSTIFNEWLWNWQEIGISIPISIFVLLAITFTSKFEFVDIKLKKDSTLRLLIASIALVVMSYMSSMSHYPGFRGGRFTSVHLTASLGVALFITTLLTSIYYRISRPVSLKIFKAIIICYFTFICLFHYNIQLDYIESWERQKIVWRKIDAILPKPNKIETIVFYSTEHDYKYTIRNAHLLSRVYPQIYGDTTNIKFIRLKGRLDSYKVVKKNGEHFILERENEGFYGKVENTKINSNHIYYLKIKSNQFRKELKLNKIGISGDKLIIAGYNQNKRYAKKIDSAFVKHLSN
jgi:hypothetical protein